MGLNEEKWQRFGGVESNTTLVNSFFENPSQMLLLIYIDANQNVVASEKFPSSLKTKGKT